jgi:hypothetical protein
MDLAEGIRKIGFRRWYERQLIEGHLYLVSCFLCLIMVMACVDGFSFRAPGFEPFLRLSAMVAGCAICMWSLVRYKEMLDVAEFAAERSVCSQCETYGILEVTGTRAAARNKDDADRVCAPTGVRCRKCGHEWTIE